MSSPVRSSCKRSSTANPRRSTEASTYTSAISEESWDRTPTEPNAFAVFGMWATSTRCLRRRVPPLVRRQVSALAPLTAKNDAVHRKDEFKKKDNLDEASRLLRLGFLPSCVCAQNCRCTRPASTWSLLMPTRKTESVSMTKTSNANDFEESAVSLIEKVFFPVPSLDRPSVPVKVRFGPKFPASLSSSVPLALPESVDCSFSCPRRPK